MNIIKTRRGNIVKNNFLIKVFLSCLLMVGCVIGADVGDGLREEDWAAVPSPFGLEKSQVANLLETQSISLNGHDWTLTPKNVVDLGEVLEGGAYEIKFVEEEDKFIRPFFEVDAGYMLRYSLFLVSADKYYESGGLEEEDEGPFAKVAAYQLTTELTEEEKVTPVISALKMNTTFAAAEELRSSDLKRYMREIIIGQSLASMGRFFIAPGYQEEFLTAVAEETAE